MHVVKFTTACWYAVQATSAAAEASAAREAHIVWLSHPQQLQHKQLRYCHQCSSVLLFMTTAMAVMQVDTTGLSLQDNKAVAAAATRHLLGEHAVQVPLAQLLQPRSTRSYMHAPMVAMQHQQHSTIWLCSCQTSHRCQLATINDVCKSGISCAHTA